MSALSEIGAMEAREIAKKKECSLNEIQTLNLKKRGTII